MIWFDLVWIIVLLSGRHGAPIVVHGATEAVWRGADASTAWEHFDSGAAQLEAKGTGNDGGCTFPVPGNTNGGERGWELVPV